jgi:hypothetical protein
VPVYNSACTTTARYQLFYIPWGTDTYIHGIQVAANPKDPEASSFKPSNICSYYIPSDQTANMTAIYYTNSLINLTVPATTDTSSKNNSLVTEPLYSATKQVYQLSSDVKYDVQSGNLIVNSTGSIIVYDRSGKPTTYTSAPNSVDISAKLTDGKAPWLANNSSNTLQIVYMTNKKNTVVLLLKIDAAGRFTTFNVARFNEYGVDNGTTSGNSDSTPPTPGPDVDPSAISDYYKWYWYWNSTGPGTNSQYSNNYLLKTQIVPPVCPSCPSMTCASSGSSGSGSSSSGTKDDNIITGTVNTVGNVANKTLDTAGNVVNKTLDTTSNLLTSGATGTANLLSSGATGATDLVKSGVSGTADLVKSGVSGTADLVKSGVSGTVDLLKDTGGALNTLATNRNAAGGGSYYGGLNTPYGSGSGYRAPGFSQGNGSIDSYSYYGALPSKGANYIPITADFSAFSK